jgi:uncharacterized protein (UPF0303 family)
MIAIEVRSFAWVTNHKLLRGSLSDNQFWIDREARVLLLRPHSTSLASNCREDIDWLK